MYGSPQPPQSWATNMLRWISTMLEHNSRICIQECESLAERRKTVRLSVLLRPQTGVSQHVYQASAQGYQSRHFTACRLLKQEPWDIKIHSCLGPFATGIGFPRLHHATTQPTLQKCKASAETCAWPVCTLRHHGAFKFWCCVSSWRWRCIDLRSHQILLMRQRKLFWGDRRRYCGQKEKLIWNEHQGLINWRS